MANETQLAILKHSVEVWNQWREDNPEIAIDLEKADLRAVDLKNADLRGVILNEANLIRANLYKADLAEAQLDKADMRWADLHRATLEKTNLDNAILSNSRLTQANLRKARLKDANLSNADLQGAYLNDAELQGADLSRANLKKTELIDANLIGADLTGADLKEAYLNRAKLEEANLGAADLSGAFLTSATLKKAIIKRTNFNFAILQDADFTDAVCGGTIFANTDLSVVRGLEALEHEQPNTLGLDILFRPNSPLPSSFLLGSGVPENLIVYLPTVLEQVLRKTGGHFSCFISHSSVDKPFARKIYQILKQRNIRCWLDEKNLIPGQDPYEGIGQGIYESERILLCCSANSLGEAWWVKYEMDQAFDRERLVMREQGNFTPIIIPLDLDGYIFNKEFPKGFPVSRIEQIRTRVIANFQGWETDDALFETQIERIIEALRAEKV